MALTSQQSTHCTDCGGDHLPDEQHAPTSRPRSGGRHLAPKKPIVAAPRPRRPNARPASPPRPKVRPAPSLRSGSTSAKFSTSPTQILKKIAAWGHRFGQGIINSARQWWAEASRGVRELIELDSLKSGTGTSRHADKPERPARPARPPRPGRDGNNDPQASSNFTSVNGPSIGAGAAEKASAARERRLEVSMLESLGFFDPANEVVVSAGPMAGLPVREMAATTPPRAPVPSLSPGARQLIPDMDLSGWKPHVIARSKLGSARMSTVMITVLSISLLVLAVAVTNLLRGPAEEAAAQEDTLTQASSTLAVALGGLETVLANVTTDVADATSTLISIDRAARDMFDAAALLGDRPDQQVLRQSAASLAQRSLALESLVGDALNYRMVLGPLWESPDLSGIVNPTEAASAVATWQASLEDMVGSLPESSQLSAHVDQVRGFVEGLEGWRLRYLDALSEADVVTAEAAVADLDGQLALLAQSGEDLLSGLFDDAGAERGRILSDLGTLSD